MPQTDRKTGIRGIARWGPVHPGPARLGRDDEEPLQAAFQVFDEEREVARFDSDSDGRFEVLLAAGVYTVVPDSSTPIPFPRSQSVAVTVPRNGFAVITLRLDTGMR